MKYCCNEDDVFYHIVMTNTKTKTKTMTKTNTKCTEHPTYAIFLKRRQFKYINYDQRAVAGSAHLLQEMVVQPALPILRMIWVN